ncbi:hypothetical protein SDC9_103928 [bioreactor metagenome]|uniref:Uncharacterized protein n=1 Tax=bioreactor metagenome TaxID=1076179 RepID=A0A645AVD4_9ZZZZ
MTKEVAERGMGDLLDLFNRDQKPSLRNYLLVLDGDARGFTSIVMEEEQFMGLYLYQLMNSQNRTLGIIDCQMYTFIERLNNPSCVNVVPVLKFTTIQAQVGAPSGGQSAGEQSSNHSSKEGGGGGSGGSGGSDSVPTLQQPYVYIDGAAVFVKTQMKAQLSARELEVYKLLTGKVHAGLLTASNPDAEGKLLGFSTLKNKFHSSATLEGDQVRLSLQLDLRVGLLEAQQTYNATPETIEQSRQNLHDVVSTRISELFERMRDENIDLFEIRKMMEDQYIFTLPEDFLKNTELDLTVNIIMDSLGTLKSSYY